MRCCYYCCYIVDQPVVVVFSRSPVYRFAARWRESVVSLTTAFLASIPRPYHPLVYFRNSILYSILGPFSEASSIRYRLRHLNNTGDWHTYGCCCAWRTAASCQQSTFHHIILLGIWCADDGLMWHPVISFSHPNLVRYLFSDLVYGSSELDCCIILFCVWHHQSV